MPDRDSTSSAKLDLASIDDEQFESLIAAIFRAKILSPATGRESSAESLSHAVVSVTHTGRGPDEGKDIMVVTWVRDCVVTRQFKWLVQCKHKPKSKKSVQLSDFKNNASFEDVVTRHGANGYLLACSTRPAKNLQSLFDALTADDRNPYQFVIWDGTTVCEEAHKHPGVMEVFFPEYYRSHFQREIEFDDVVGWLQQNRVSTEERQVLSAALREVVTPNDAPEGGQGSAGE